MSDAGDMIAALPKKENFVSLNCVYFQVNAKLNRTWIIKTLRNITTNL